MDEALALYLIELQLIVMMVLFQTLLAVTEVVEALISSVLKDGLLLAFKGRYGRTSSTEVGSLGLICKKII